MALRDPPPSSDEPSADRLEFETLIADLSSRFVNVSRAEVDREVEDALARVCGVLRLDLAVLWQWSTTSPGSFAATHYHYSQPGLAPPEPLREEQFPWFIGQMLAGHVVALSSIEDLPPEAATDLVNCRLFGVRSNLTLPLGLGGEAPLGALGLNALNEPREWSDALVTRLQLFAQVLTNALARRRADEALHQAEERVSLAADAAEAGLWRLDDRTGVFWVTSRTRAIFGFGPDEIVDMARLRAAVHPDDWAIVTDGIQRAMHREAPVDVEYRIRARPDERWRWIAARGQLQAHDTGSMPCLMGYCIDVTRRKQAEELVRLRESRLASAADLARLGFYEVSFEEDAAFVDDRLRDLLGVPPERHAGLGPLEFWLERLHPEDRQRVLDHRTRLHAGSLERLEVEYRFLNPLQGERWIHHLARVADRDAAGRAVRTYGVMRDITDRRRDEEALRQSYAQIRELKDRLQAESDYLKAEIGAGGVHAEITGQSPVIQRVLRQIEQVAPTDATVLVLGETGTGKERIAQAIHRLSPRHRQVMVRVNCAALPSGLIESELFGREKGAFTGALARQVGRFEIADGSTLFLDEIGELSLDVQSKLLRVLESGEFERLGSPRTIKVSVRVIAATNRDLVAAIREGRFREDLYYRLNVFPIRVPPLRERREDIPSLVWALLNELNARMGKKIMQVSRVTMDTLQRHAWPGNVRELRNVLEHAVIVASGATLRVPTLEGGAPGAAVPEALADVERAHILRVLEQRRWRVKGPDGAAAALGMNPSTLRSRMMKLGIDRPKA